MKELDFDELDKAVNSLMSGAPNSAPVKIDDIKTITIKSQLPSNGGAPDFNQILNQTSQSLPPESPQPKSATSDASGTSAFSLASRRAGRFMDVVRPNSEVKKPLPSASPSRQGLTIEPHLLESSTPNTDEDQPKPDEPAFNNAPVANDAIDHLDSVDDGLHKSEWPDPLEMSDFKPEPTAAEEPQAVTQPDEASSLETEDATYLLPTEPADLNPPEPAKPLSSPFLADAKVEKRPLGGNSGDISDEKSDEPGRAPILGELAQEDSFDKLNDSQLPPKPSETSAQLPEELSSHLMAIESDNQPLLHAPVEPQSDPEVSAAKDLPPKDRDEAASTAQAVKAASASSITQQYQQEPASSEQTSGAVFDTVAYHQPLLHPVKKKPGWLWVAAVIGILLLGAASGAALYFLGII